MPPAGRPLAEPVDGPAYDLKFPDRPVRANVERDRSRVIRLHGIKHLRELKSRPRSEGDRGAV
jgi:hypothetical protein